MMKKKILFITQALWVGGIETALVNLINRLSGEDYELACLILRGETDLAPRLSADCRLLIGDREKSTFPRQYPYTRLYHLTEQPTNPSPLHRALQFAVPLLRWLESRLYIRWLRRQLSGESFDTAVIYSDAVAEAAARAVCARRFLMFYHHGAMRKAYRDRIAYRKSEKVFAVSAHQAEQLRQFRPEFAHKITFAHNLTDISGIRRRSEAPIPEDFPPERAHIVTCGRLAPEKGMDLAVDACAQLVKAGHTQFHWWIVGGGPCEAALRAQIRQLGLEKHMTLTGMRTNPCPYIRRAAVYVQPSRVEGYPMAVLEALALERPVVAVDNPGSREALRGGRDGILCGASADEIAHAVEAALNAPPHRPPRDWEQENQDALQALRAWL